MRYRPDIDGLRAVAVLLVVVFHFALLPFGKAGFLGVDVFFVISGFLVTAIVRRQIEERRFVLGAFYSGRVRRLAPALCAVLLATLAFGYFALLPFEFEELAKQLVATQAYLANVYFWRNINYFGLGAGNVYLLHAWSLAVEEQFYLLYPLALLLVYRQRRWHPAVLVAIAAVTSFALNVLMVWRWPEATFYLLPTRAWELLAGALLTWLPSSRLESRWRCDGLGAAGAAAIVAAVLTYDRGIAVPGVFAVLPVAGAACLIMAGSHEGSFTRRALSVPACVYIGRISYALYLVHWPINTFARGALSEDYTLPWRLLAFAASLLAAALIYHRIENPIRYGYRLKVRSHLLGAYAAAVAATFAACGWIIASDGAPARLPARVAQLAAFSIDKSPPLAGCEYHDAAQPLRPCAIGTAGRPLRWLVVGDSHAWAAHDAFSLWLQRRGEAGVFAFRHGCPPLAGIELVGDRRGLCRGFNVAVREFLDAHAEIHGVVLASSWLQIDEGALAEVADQRPDRDRSVRLFERAIADTLTWLGERGKVIYLWAPVPHATAHVPRALAAAEWRGQPSPSLGMTLDEYYRLFGYYFSALARHRAQVAVSIEPARSLCVNGVCRVSIDGRPVFFDNSHVTRSSAGFWAEAIEAAERRARLSTDAREP